MKNRNLYFTLLIGLLLLTAACHKNQNVDCPLIATGVRPAIMFQITDSQKRDLLDPVTPNHYDTAAIRQLNNNRVFILPNNTAANRTGKIMLMLSYPNGEYNNIYSLSATDQDTVYTNNANMKKGCSSYTELIAVKYNGKLYADTLSGHTYVIVK